MKIAYFALGRVHFDQELAGKYAKELFRQLDKAGYNLVGSQDILWDVSGVKKQLDELDLSSVDLLVIFHATFTDSSLVLEIASNIQIPIVLWSIPEKWSGGRLQLNSFTGMHLAAHALKINQIPYYYIYAAIDDNKALTYLKSLSRAATVICALKNTRLGVVGDHPDGFETSMFDTGKVYDLFGVTVQKYTLESFFAAVNKVPERHVENILVDVTEILENVESLNQQALQKTLAVHAALVDLSKEEDLDGIAVRCWPEFFEELGCSACGALALTIEKDIACSCEADLLGLLSQIILQILSSSPALGTDIVGFDTDDNLAAVWHCGMAPISMANHKYPAEAINHGNRNLPLLLQFPFKPGKITLARISQTDGEFKIFTGRGEMLDKPRPFSGTCGIFKLERPVSDILETIIVNGMEHHLAFTYGDYLTELNIIADMLHIPIINL